MTYNQRFRYGQPSGNAYGGEDLKVTAYRHLATSLLISAVIVMAINFVFYQDFYNSTLIMLYIVGSVVEGLILLALFFMALFRAQLSESTATIILYVFAVASSLSLSFIVDLYLTALTNGVFIVTMTFGIAAVVTFGIYAYTSANKPDTTGLQKKMFVVTIVFMIIVLLGFFVFSGSNIFYLFVSGVGALIFAIYMYIDFARLETRQFSSPAMMALALFIDIIYFIQYLLEFLAMIMGQSKR